MQVLSGAKLVEPNHGWPPGGAESVSISAPFAGHEEREVENLRPHPSYLRNNLCVAAVQLTKLEELGDSAFRDPVVITKDGTVLDGYARLALAKLKKRQSLPCLVYELNEFEALEFLLLKHRQPSAWNVFNRILLALDLEPELREEARRRQSLGGRYKLLATLPEAERFDVRSRIAATAGVSPRNIDKAKFILERAVPEVLQMLRNGEVRIHRGWTWSKLSPKGQHQAVLQFKDENGLKKTIHMLVAAHKLKAAAISLSVSDLVQLASQCGRGRPPRVFEVDLPGDAIFVTKALAQRTLSDERPAS